MSKVGQWEIQPQWCVVDFFKNTLGYEYPGNWKGRLGNSNIEEELLADWLKRQGHNDQSITKTLFQIIFRRAVASFMFGSTRRSR